MPHQITLRLGACYVTFPFRHQSYNRLNNNGEVHGHVLLRLLHRLNHDSTHMHLYIQTCHHLHPFTGDNAMPSAKHREDSCAAQKYTKLYKEKNAFFFSSARVKLITGGSRLSAFISLVLLLSRVFRVWPGFVPTVGSFPVRIRKTRWMAAAAFAASSPCSTC